MMDYAGEMILEMWNAVKPFIEKKERDDVALNFLRAAEDYINLEDAREEIGGQDKSLDKAFNELVGEETMYDEDDEFNGGY